MVGNKAHHLIESLQLIYLDISCTGLYYPRIDKIPCLIMTYINNNISLGWKILSYKRSLELVTEVNI